MDCRQPDFRSRMYRHGVAGTTQGPTTPSQHLQHRAPFLKQVIDRWIPPSRSIRILDLGCGDGALLCFLQKAGYDNLRGIDNSSEQVARAKQRGLASVTEADALDTLKKSAAGSYDVIIAFDVLEHFSKQDVLVIADEVHRVLAAGGRFILHVPNGEAIFSGLIYFSDLTHETCFTRQSLRQLMSVAGFTRLSFSEATPVVHGILSAGRYLMWKFFRNVFRLLYMAETGNRGQDLLLTQTIIAVAEK